MSAVFRSQQKISQECPWVSRQDSTWNRQELYEKVWHFPLRKLAVEYGISDVGLAKVCRKLEIPLPGLGYWTRIACGHTIARPPLPVMENIPVLIRRIREPETHVLPEDTPEVERIERVATATTPPVTKAMLAHPLIEKTRLLLNEARSRDGEKLWASRETEWLDLRVTKNCLARALRIMAVIIYILEREGFKLVVEKKQSNSTSAIVCGETIRFGLLERSRQVKPSPKPDATARYSYDSIRLEPNGVLSIEIWNYYGGGLQKAWRDRDAAPVEEQLPKCVAGMIRIALKERAERDKQEKEERAKQKRIDAVRAELRQIEKEERKIKALKREAVRWRRAERLRTYIDAVRRDAVRKTDPEDQAKVLEWVEWAERQADRIDPLQPSPHSLVDDKEKVIRRLEAVEGWWWAKNDREEESEADSSEQQPVQS
jgi:hypothetical protein